MCAGTYRPNKSEKLSDNFAFHLQVIGLVLYAGSNGISTPAEAHCGVKRDLREFCVIDKV